MAEYAPARVGGVPLATVILLLLASVVGERYFTQTLNPPILFTLVLSVCEAFQGGVPVVLG